MSARRSSIALTLIATGLAALAPACSTPTGLPAATDSNTVDTVSLFALSDALTDIALQNPSAYLVQGELRVRTDLSTVFDFAFDVDTAGRPVLLPTGAMHLRSEEHTSELQSHSDLVCRLLLEKKKRGSITCRWL